LLGFSEKKRKKKRSLTQGLSGGFERGVLAGIPEREIVVAGSLAGISAERKRGKEEFGQSYG